MINLSIVQANLDNGTRKIGLSYAKSAMYILDIHGTGTEHIKSVVQWSVISKFACTIGPLTTVLLLIQVVSPLQFVWIVWL